ncbi:MAG: hypothetical protein RLZZ385_2355 [Pseudomonadota bacterium]|jgi:NADH-quinone oxidoreductase subunit N
MQMTAADLLTLLPLLLTAAVAVVLMLLIAARRNHTLTCAATIFGMAFAILALLWQGTGESTQVTPLLIVDGMSWFFSLLLLSVAGFIAVFSYPYLRRLQDQVEEFYLLLTIATVGAMVMVSSNHFISAFLGMETLSISLYAMVAYPLHSKQAAKFPLEAGIKYLVLSAVASALFLFGVALLYAHSGSLSFTELQLADTGGVAGTAYTGLAFTLILAGMAFKLSLAPFHIWTPDVYEGAPLPATAFLATTGKAAMAVLLLRLLLDTGALALTPVITVLYLLAAVSMVAGNLLALVQDNLKRLLAYSSIAHMGYLLVAVITANSATSTLGIETVGFYLVAYIIMSLGAFGVSLAVSSGVKEFDFIGDYQGLFWREPWLATLMTTMLLSLAGIPLTAGFIGKLYVVLAGVQGSQWALLLLLVIGSGIGVYYYLRVIYRMVLPATVTSDFRIAGWASIGTYVVLGFLLFMVLLLGIFPSLLMDLLQSLAAGI